MLKIFRIALHAIPVAIMIALIPAVKNDYALAALYIGIIALLFIVNRKRHDISVLIFGLIAMTIAEYVFIKTGVETFSRTSLLGIMPIWLPILWAYGFVAIRKGIAALTD